MPATPNEFDQKAWIRRFGAALERTVAGARHMGVPFGIYGTMRIGAARRERHRRYLEMAALANIDAYAAKLFDESHLWLDALPDGVLDLLREHPAIAQAWSAGSREGFHLGGVFGRVTDDVSSLIAQLAKLSARVGGAYAATPLRMYSQTEREDASVRDDTLSSFTNRMPLAGLEKRTISSAKSLSVGLWIEDTTMAGHVCTSEQLT